MAIRLTPARELNIEQAIEWINDDELVEVAPGGDPRSEADSGSQREENEGKNRRLTRSRPERSEEPRTRSARNLHLL